MDFTRQDTLNSPIADLDEIQLYSWEKRANVKANRKFNGAIDLEK